jgi:hypothetical protein
LSKATTADERRDSHLAETCSWTRIVSWLYLPPRVLSRYVQYFCGSQLFGPPDRDFSTAMTDPADAHGHVETLTLTHQPHRPAHTNHRRPLRQTRHESPPSLLILRSRYSWGQIPASHEVRMRRAEGLTRSRWFGRMRGRVCRVSSGEGWVTCVTMRMKSRRVVA